MKISITKHFTNITTLQIEPQTIYELKALFDVEALAVDPAVNRRHTYENVNILVVGDGNIKKLCGFMGVAKIFYSFINFGR